MNKIPPRLMTDEAYRQWLKNNPPFKKVENVKKVDDSSYLKRIEEERQAKIKKEEEEDEEYRRRMMNCIFSY